MSDMRLGSRSTAVGLVIVSAALVGGCSTDFRRLEQPSLALNEPTGPRPSEGMTSRRSGAGAPVDRGEGWPESGPRAPLPPPAPITSQPLPPPSAQPPVAGQSKPFDRPKPVAVQPAASPARAPLATAGTVDVQPGDTLYAIAKRHRVSLAELMEANQLKSPNLKPGQKLVLPVSGSKRPATRPTQVASAGATIPASALPTPAAPPAAASPAAPPSSSGSTHTVKAGESLSGIARTNKVSVADLQSLNGITDPTKVRPGTVLKIPGTAGGPVAEAPKAPVATPVTTVAAPIAPTPGMPSPRIINSKPEPVAPAPETASTEPTVAPIAPTAPAAPTVVASAPTTAVASPAPGAASGKFRWPAKGQLLHGFGKRPDGTQSDGIAVSVPVGTDVSAAGDGTVAYAGSELKGYGNLILVRHDNGYVSAYAHTSEILVKRGDVVKRGQVIAKSGQTGTIETPMLHFELRQGTKPVDPVPHLEKM